MPRKARDLGTKYCTRCGSAMTRKRFGNRLEDASAFLRLRFCSLSCANQRGNWGQSSTARHRQAHKSVQPFCEICKATPKRLSVHHKDGNYQNNVLSNLQTLCTSCHKKTHLCLLRFNG